MATILTKKSDTASAVPLAADLTNAAGGAELAVNATDKRLFSKTSGGTVVELGTNPTAMAVVGNTTVGGTLGVTGATTLAGVSATTLSASSTVTLSGGTANGVVYLNGSKVVTSGSALTFDGSSLGMGSPTVYGTRSLNSYTGTTASAIGFSQQISGFANTFLGSNNSGSSVLGMATGTFGQSTSNSIPWTVSAYGSEQMRLTSTGLGIGTSSPSTKLHVAGGSLFTGSYSGYSGGEVMLGATTADTQNTVSTQATGSPVLLFDHRGTNNIGLFKWRNGSGAGTTLMELAASGNLGLGVTPSAWQTGANLKAFQVGVGAAFFSDTNSAYLGQNVYQNSVGTSLYINTNYASKYQQSSSVHSWHIAASGTAGNAITFTQAMTLTADGKLGVGVTSPTNKIDLGFTDTTIGWYLSASYSAGISYNSGARSMTLSTKSADSADFIAFSTGTAATERARIDSSGNLLVGTTSANGKFYVSSASGASSSNARFDLTGNSLTAANVYSVYTGTGNNNNNFKHFAAYSGDSGTEVFRVYGQGNVVNTNNSYGAISDIKLKENIVDATPKLANLMQVKVRNYNLIGDTTKQLGVVAQEIETIFPSLIDETPDRDLEGNYLGTTTKQVKYSVFVPMLIKAMQEQQAIIDLLKARLDAANL